MAKLTTNDISNITGAETTAISTLNNNFSAIETALENTLSRDGTSPNQMNADLDMNNKDILNVGGIEVNSVIVAGDTIDLVDLVDQADRAVKVASGAGPTLTVGTDGQILSIDANGDIESVSLAELSPPTIVPTSFMRSAIEGWDNASEGRSGLDVPHLYDNATELLSDIAAATGQTLFRLNNSTAFSVGSATDLGLSALEMDSGATFTGAGDINPSGYTFTNSERYGKKITNTSVDAYDIYGSIFPNVSYYDVFQSVARLHSGSNLASHLSAISGYVKVDAPVSGSGNNAVSLFGGGMVTVDSGAAWGINTLLTDAATRTVHTGTGRKLLGAELDFNVMSPSTEVIGVSVGGNSLSQPTTANAFLVNTLSASLGYKWTTGLFSMDGAATNALAVGMTHDGGANRSSQNVLFSWSNGSSVKAAITLSAAAGFLSIAGGHLSLDANSSVFLQTGQGVRVNGNTIISDRRTGWTASTGTLFRGSFDANYTQTIGATYSQVQVQAIQDLLVTSRQRIAALEDDLRAHGIIN